MLDKGLASAVLRIDRGFGRDVKGNKGAEFQMSL